MANDVAPRETNCQKQLLRTMTGGHNDGNIHTAHEKQEAVVVGRQERNDRGEKGGGERMAARERNRANAAEREEDTAVETTVQEDAERRESAEESNAESVSVNR